MTNPAYAAVLRGLLDAGADGGRPRGADRGGPDGVGDRRRAAGGLRAARPAAPALRRRRPRRRDHPGGLRRPPRHLGAGDDGRGSGGGRWPRTGRGAPGPCCCRRCTILEGYPDDELDPQTGRRRPPPGRGAQARAGRPRRLVRRPRPGRRRAARAARRPALRRVRRRPPGADRRPGVRAPAARARCPAARRTRPRCARSRRTRTPRAWGSRRWRAAARPAATPATSTSSTAGATSSRPRPSGGWLQSSPHVPELGFCLGTRLQMTWLDEASPSALRPGPAAADDAQPHPAAARRGRRLRARHARRRPAGPVAAGLPAAHARRRLDAAAGDRRADPAHDGDGGLVLAADCGPRAASSPRTGSGAEVLEGLTARGHAVTAVPGWTLGRLSSVTRDPATGELGAAANPRGEQGYAVGR